MQACGAAAVEVTDLCAVAVEVTDLFAAVDFDTQAAARGLPQFPHILPSHHAEVLL